MQQVTSRDGIPIAYWQSGSGPALLLVHGTTADHRRWDTLAPYLNQDFTLYAMDRRGRGGSGDSADYTIVREAEDIAAVVDAIAEATGGSIDVLAHSHGATCSLEAALLTIHMRRLILYEPPIPPVPPSPPGFLEHMQELVDNGEPEAALEMFFREKVGMPDSELEVFRKLPMWPVRVALAGTIPREELAERSYQPNAERFAALRAPTLVMVGGASPDHFQQAGEVVNALLPDSRLVVMPGQRHVAMDTDPAMFTGMVRDFLMG